MSVVDRVNLITTQTWPQGDIRDPLGIWGFRRQVSADASGGNLNLTVASQSGVAPAYVYTVYSLTIGQLTGVQTALLVKVRLLTNWPNVDLQAGVQAYGTIRVVQTTGSLGYSGELTGIGLEGAVGVTPLERFLLLYDPRASTGEIDIINFQLPLNIDPSTWTFEGYGYYWDRSVMQAPGGPRHPGSN